MRYYIFFIPLFFTTFLFCPSTKMFQLILEPRWDDLEHNAKKEKQFGSKLILIGKIIFKKKTTSPINLNKIILQWHGHSIETLSGSLYKKKPEKRFIPIDEHVICDSTWNKEQQTLVLNFNQTQKLGIHSEFYLILSVPEHLEKILKTGYFSIEEKCLCQVLKETHKKDDTLVIALSDPIQKKKIINIHS